MGELDLALPYFQKSIELHKALDNKFDVVLSLTNLGLLYTLKGNYGQAIDIYSQNLRIEAGVYPRLRIAVIVGIRGSSQPVTNPSATSCINLRLLSTV